jgi:SAM-dependent methyltransferase
MIFRSCVYNVGKEISFMDIESLNLETLRRLRETFLGGEGRRNYWQSEEDLFAYEQTFAQRIGWKWTYVLGELERLGWTPPAGDVLDFGCGSGIASRVFLRRFGAAATGKLVLSDRSTLAMQFASRLASEEFPGLNISCTVEPPSAPAVLLISHVLTELSPQSLERLVELASAAAATVWVEPGSHEASRALIAVRERLREKRRLAAPCTHQNPCGLLVPECQRHWCHFFADTPAEISGDGNWARFARAAGIDLRALPVSYLVLDSRPAPVLPAGATRVLGRARLYKGYAMLLGCDETGVHDRRMPQKFHPEAYKLLRREQMPPLQAWTCEGEKIVSLEPIQVNR